MRVMFNITDTARGMHTNTMTRQESKAEPINWKGLLSGDPDCLKRWSWPLLKRHSKRGRRSAWPGLVIAAAITDGH